MLTCVAPKWKKSKRTADPVIRVNQVGRYAYGADSNNRVAIWAAGKAGWYTILPNEAYKPIFTEMKESVQAWYFILDSCAGESIPPSEVFKRFAIKYSVKQNKAEAKLQAHGSFIFANMKENKEQVKWKTKPMFHFFKMRVVSIKDAVYNHSKQSRSHSPLPFNRRL